MDGTDRDLGWEDVGQGSGTAKAPDFASAAVISGLGAAAGSLGGQMGEASSVPGSGPISDAVTSAMVNHFASEFTKGSLSLWPQFAQTARRYFNVSHGYVLRKALWQLVPTNSLKKKSTDGELGRDKDWTARMYEGLEVDIEEPDMYIPTMGFCTYVLLCGMIKGLQAEFHPDVLYTYISFAVITLVIEVALAKAALFMAGAVNAPVFDLAALFGYKYFYLCLQLVIGIFLAAQGFFYHLIALGLVGACSFALFQSLRRLARMQPAVGQECVAHVHDVFIKVLPVMQALAYYLLLPSWPKPAAVALEAAVASAGAASPVIAATSAPMAAAAATIADVITTILPAAAATA